MPDDRTEPARRVTTEPGGPVLIEGPVEVVLPDGRTERSDRFVVALCTCRRSRSYPWCDTSHRRRTGGNERSGSDRGAGADGPGGTGESPGDGDASPAAEGPSRS
ncbi:CDGSH iron-sulfur domain-containing protein [Streptomyces sp. 549]|uniref:CDGSH iron-sulfur domain-containing protein n=1 Tax=Streptomyces sp. 549 TaxID=3049076 RepID=UPI0024C41CC0|nr:CDGSH iron-sulfur domain-containing protein [Streptomyces sp. 549]MDK1471953.1 CDGSH iron-sulfur domain-containing protein [Streptomyces sp. 549]